MTLEKEKLTISDKGPVKKLVGTSSVQKLKYGDRTRTGYFESNVKARDSANSSM